MGQLASAAVLIFMVFLCFHIKDQGMNQTLFEQALSEGKRVLFHQTARQYAMQIGYIMEQDGTKKTAAQVLLELSGRPFPLTEYIDTADGYETQVESHFSYEEIVAMEALDEPDAADGTALNGAADAEVLLLIQRHDLLALGRASYIDRIALQIIAVKRMKRLT